MGRMYNGGFVSDEEYVRLLSLSDPVEAEAVAEVTTEVPSHEDPDPDAPSEQDHLTRAEKAAITRAANKAAREAAAEDAAIAANEAAITASYEVDPDEVQDQPEPDAPETGYVVAADEDAADEDLMNPYA